MQKFQKPNCFKKTVKGVDCSMRHKLKKEAADTIAVKIANDGTGKIFGDLLVLADATHRENMTRENPNTFSREYQNLLSQMDWLYGYQVGEITELMRSLKECFMKMAFYKGSSHVKILTSIATIGVLSSYNHVLTMPAEEDVESWEIMFEESENKKVSVCYEIFKRHCPLEITVKDFLEARMYIRLWDSDFNW